MTIIKINNKVKLELERFLKSSWYNEFEWGGFLLERNGIIDEAVIIPNISDSPKNSYKLPLLSKTLAEKIAYSYRQRKTIAAEWHSHPEPFIMSQADTCYSQSKDVIEVMITPLSKYSYHADFEWYACKGMEPVRIQFVGK